MKFSDRLKSKRKLKGLTQKQVADAIGVTKVAVSRWELGHSIPTGKSLALLADVIDSDPEWLLNGEECGEGSVVMIKYYQDAKVSAGNGYMPCSEMSQNKVPIPKNIVDKQSHRDSLCCVKVSGNSMEPVLYNGSIIALNPYKRVVNDGMMYVIRQGDLLRVKILIETPKGIIIRSYHHDFEDEIYRKDNFSDLEIIGQVFWYSTSINI